MKPMLAAATDGKQLTYPCLLSPKLDGVRCLIIDGVAMSRSLKPIPNKHVQKLFGRQELNGLDGELIVGPATADNVFQKTSSGVMSIEGEPDVCFHVFDDFTEAGGFKKRLHTAQRRLKKFKQCREVYHLVAEDEDETMGFEQDMLAMGYEGIMVRHPEGPYKHGRSTAKEGWLLKIKRFVDAEAEVIGFTQLMTNKNEAKANELGHLERSSKKEGLIGAGVLGAIKVRDCLTGVEFEIGTGFTAEQRQKFWHGRQLMIGQLVKYKSQPVGVKDKPRFPVFLGFRDVRDL